MTTPLQTAKAFIHYMEKGPPRASWEQSTAISLLEVSRALVVAVEALEEVIDGACIEAEAEVSIAEEALKKISEVGT